MPLKFFFRIVLALIALATATQAKERWIYARSDHFEMFSSDSETESRRELAKLEQFRAFFVATYALREAREPRTFVVQFGSASAFDRFRPTNRSDSDRVLSYVTTDGDEVTMALTTDLGDDDTRDPDGAILRDYVEVMLRAHGIKVPYWLQRGLANLYSTFDVDGGKVVVGRANALFVDYLNDAPLLPVEQLFSLQPASEFLKDRAHAAEFDAESWALTHYLICGGKAENAGKLAHFIELVNAAPDRPEENFRKAFGATYEQMRQALGRYLGGGEYVQRWAKVPLPGVENRLTFRPAADFDRDMILTDLRWRLTKNNSAKAAALDLSRHEPGSPRPFELLASIEQANGETNEAAAHWRRAADLGSENPAVYVRAVKAAMGPPSAGIPLDQVQPDALTAQLRRWIDRALTLDPYSAEGLESLAWIEAQAREVRVSAINRVQRGVPNLPQPLKTLYALAVVRWRVGDQATATNLTEHILAAKDAPPELRTAVNLLQTRLASRIRNAENP